MSANWIQGVTESIKRRGTEGKCTGSNFGGPGCPPGSKQYNLAKTFRKMATQRSKKEFGGGVADMNKSINDITGERNSYFTDFVSNNTTNALIENQMIDYLNMPMMAFGGDPGDDMGAFGYDPNAAAQIEPFAQKYAQQKAQNEQAFAALPGAIVDSYNTYKGVMDQSGGMKQKTKTKINPEYRKEYRQWAKSQEEPMMFMGGGIGGGLGSMGAGAGSMSGGPMNNFFAGAVAKGKKKGPLGLAKTVLTGGKSDMKDALGDLGGGDIGALSSLFEFGGVPYYSQFGGPFVPLEDEYPMMDEGGAPPVNQGFQGPTKEQMDAIMKYMAMINKGRNTGAMGTGAPGGCFPNADGTVTCAPGETEFSEDNPNLEQEPSGAQEIELIEGPESQKSKSGTTQKPNNRTAADVVESTRGNTSSQTTSRERQRGNVQAPSTDEGSGQEGYPPAYLIPKRGLRDRFAGVPNMAVLYNPEATSLQSVEFRKPWFRPGKQGAVKKITFGHYGTPPWERGSMGEDMYYAPTRDINMSPAQSNRELITGDYEAPVMSEEAVGMAPWMRYTDQNDTPVEHSVFDPETEEAIRNFQEVFKGKLGKKNKGLKKLFKREEGGEEMPWATTEVKNKKTGQGKAGLQAAASLFPAVAGAVAGVGRMITEGDQEEKLRNMTSAENVFRADRRPDFGQVTFNPTGVVDPYGVKMAPQFKGLAPMDGAAKYGGEQYQEGGEYELSEEQVAQILAQGGQIEYLD